MLLTLALLETEMKWFHVNVLLVVTTKLVLNTNLRKYLQTVIIGFVTRINFIQINRLIIYSICC